MRLRMLFLQNSLLVEAVFPCSSKVIDMAEMSIQLRGTVAVGMLNHWSDLLQCTKCEKFKHIMMLLFPCQGLSLLSQGWKRNWLPKWDIWFFSDFFLVVSTRKHLWDRLPWFWWCFAVSSCFQGAKAENPFKNFKVQTHPKFWCRKKIVRMLWRCCEADAKWNSSCTSGNLDVEVDEKNPFDWVWRFSVQKPPENGRKGWDFYEKWCFGGESCVFCLQHDVRPSSPSAQDKAFGWP